MSRLAFLVLLILTPAAAVAGDRESWAALASGGHIALVRHGNAPPGYGDPPGFRLDDCSTQRNMDELGRTQARAMGEAFRQHRIAVDKVQSSPVCRCLETARLMALGAVDSVVAVAASKRSPQHLDDLKRIVSSWQGPGTLVLVTHAFTIQTLVGFLPEQASIAVVKPKPGAAMGIEHLGIIATPK